MRIGVVVPDLMGHVNPAIELARELNALGHEAVLLTRPPAGQRARELGQWSRLFAVTAPGRDALGRRGGMPALRGLATYLRHANAQLMGGPLDGLCDELCLDALAIDETLQGACLVAARRGMPYATFCAALPMAYDPKVPPPIFAWQPARGWLGRVRDRLGWALFAWLFRGVLRDLERYRKAHNIPLFDADGQSVYVGCAQVTQLPWELDFSRESSALTHTGPWVTRDQEDVPFPWSWLDPKRALVYVCMGTVVNSDGAADAVCDAVESAARRGAQVVVSMGGQGMGIGGVHGSLRSLYSSVRERLFGQDTLGVKDVLVVPWAPHYALIERSDLFVTNCGLNSALAAVRSRTNISLCPQAFDQPGVAARILFASSRGAVY